MREVVLVNRILIDESLDFTSKVNNILTVDIKENVNLLINSAKYDYIINCYKKNVNILTILENDSSLNIKINVYEGSVCFNSINYNGKNERISVNLNEEDSYINIYNSIISKTKQNIDVFVYHNKSKTYSNVYNAASTLLDGSVLFNVESKVFKGNKECILNQDSKIISLNDSNKNKVNPVLLIDEYDTEAKHSCFIGKFNSNEVFYLMTRGISKKQAYTLLLEGLLIGLMNVSDEEKEDLKEKLNEKWR